MTELKRQKLLFILASIIGIANALWNDGPCKSDDCWKQRAREIEKSLDVTIDPCDNFYEFSCGGWIKKNPAPRYYESWTPANVYELKMMNGFAKILNSPDESTDSLSLKSMKHIYKNCMDTNLRDEIGFIIIIESFKIIGGWPILGDKYQTPLEVIPMIILPVISKVFGVDTFITVNHPKRKNYREIFVHWSRSYNEKLDQILKKFERNSTEVKQYINIIVKTVKEISKNSGIPFNPIKALQDANDIIDFQLELIEVVEKSLPGGSESFENSEDFKDWFDVHSSGINNSHALRFCYLNPSVLSSTENQDTQFFVENIKLLENLIVLFDKTKPNTLQNFIIWDLVYKYLEFLPTRMYDIEYELNNIGQATPGLFLNREERCIKNLPFLSALVPKFISEYYPENYKNSSNDIITKVIKSSEEYVNKTSWMSFQLQNTALQEISNSIQYNYYSLPNNNYIDELYGYPKFVSNHYLEDSLLISRLKYRRQQERFNNPDLDSKSLNFLDGPIISVLSYLLSKFQPNVPQASNYGTFASIAGQSVTTFISFINSIFDKRTDDWPNDMKTEFIERFRNFEVLDNSTSYGLSDDTKKAYTDSFLEDNLGIPAAFAAYEKNKIPEDEEISLPNYPMYKDRKLFFISYASSLCTSENPNLSVNKENENLKISQKVNIALRNMKEFSDAFSCPKDSPMNPTSKVHVFGPDDQMDSDY